MELGDPLVDGDMNRQFHNESNFTKIFSNNLIALSLQIEETYSEGGL